MSHNEEHVRRLVQWGRQDRGEAAIGRSPIRSVGILGAGMMGTAIAAAHLQHRVPVVICDVKEDVLAGAIDAVAAELHKAQVELPPEIFRRLVRSTADLAEAARCDLVLESIPESLPLKRTLFSQLHGRLNADTIVTSNTSTIPIGRLADSVPDASRFCGMHFFHPVHQRPLVEIVRGPQSSERTIAEVITHVKNMGWIPLVVSDGPGFVVNRLLFPYLSESLQLLREGIRAEVIERAATEFGMALGPLRLMDEIGLDTTLQAGWVLAMAFPERIASSPLLVSMVKTGRLGKKALAGFYSYRDQDDPEASSVPDPALETLFAPWIDSVQKPSCEPIAYRLILPMLWEAIRILDEGKVRNAQEIDLAMLFGLGFPADKGGLLWWADTLGVDHLLTQLESWNATEIQRGASPTLDTLTKVGGGFYRTHENGF